MINLIYILDSSKAYGVVGNVKELGNWDIENSLILKRESVFKLINFAYIFFLSLPFFYTICVNSPFVLVIQQHKIVFWLRIKNNKTTFKIQFHDVML